MCLVMISLGNVVEMLCSICYCLILSVSFSHTLVTLITSQSVMHHSHHNLWVHQSDQIDELVFLGYQNKCFSTDIWCPFACVNFCSCSTHFPSKGCDFCQLAATLSPGDLPLAAFLHHLLFWMNALLNQAALWPYICIYLSVLSCGTGLFFMPPLWPIKVTLLSVWVARWIRIGLAVDAKWQMCWLLLKLVNQMLKSWFMWAWLRVSETVV